MRRELLWMAPGAVAVTLLVGCAESLIESFVDRGSLSATIDGTQFSDDVAYLKVGASTITIYAANTARETFEIRLERSLIPGTVQLTEGTNKGYWRPEPEDSSRVYTSFEGSGSVTVTFFDGHRCQGTFSFRARTASGAEVNITNGSFNVSEQEFG